MKILALPSVRSSLVDLFHPSYSSHYWRRQWKLRVWGKSYVCDCRKQLNEEITSSFVVLWAADCQVNWPPPFAALIWPTRNSRNHLIFRARNVSVCEFDFWSSCVNNWRSYECISWTGVQSIRSITGILHYQVMRIVLSGKQYHNFVKFPPVTLAFVLLLFFQASIHYSWYFQSSQKRIVDSPLVISWFFKEKVCSCYHRVIHWSTHIFHASTWI